MPVKTTYPHLYDGTGRVRTEQGFMIEVHQGYAIIPGSNVASVPLMDVDSPDPLNPIQLTIPANSLSGRQYHSLTGVVLCSNPAGFILMGSLGTLKVASALNVEAGVGVSSVQSAGVVRAANGNLLLGTSIPRGSCITSSGLPNYSVTSLDTASRSFSVFGATGDSNTATAVNFASTTPANPCVVLVTIRSMVRLFETQTVADYPGLPQNALEVLSIRI
jgi:hypothetical protein